MKIKLRSTTPQLKKLAASFTLVGLAVVISTTSSLHVFADRFDDQINQIQNEVNSYQDQAARLRSEGDTLQNALNILTAEKNAIQADITLNEAKLEQLKADITTNEEKLARQKQAISKTVAQIYVNGSTSPIEMLAGSKSIGEYVSAQEVRNSVRNQLKSAMDEVKRLRDELAAQKIEVEQKLADQNERRNLVAAKEIEQSNLVAATRGEEAAYQGLIAAKNGEISDLKSQQAAANRRLSAGASVSAGDPNMGGYPNNLRGPIDSMVDPWGMYNRECVSYTAWKVYQKNGYMPFWGGRGNANEWPSSAASDGIETGYTPRPRSVAISMSGFYGHAMWVEDVNGGMITVSQMNYDLAGSYSEMTISGSGLIYIYF